MSGEANLGEGDALEQAAETLELMIEGVRRGELTAPPGLVARLEGAVAALRAASAVGEE